MSTSAALVRGSCLCGDVRYAAARPLSLMTHCHCSMCRKAHAAPFATYVGARTDGFTFSAGEDRIARFRSSPDTERCFCPRCGSVVPTPPGESTRVFLPAGGLDDDPGVRPEAHIFAASRASFYIMADTLPRYDTYPSAWNLPALERSPEPASDSAHVRGSCLCGDVAFELARARYEAYHCHCSRCRKARAAAHASNTAVEAAQLRWVRGRDARASYKVPEAERFTHVFCRRCGSGMPLERGERTVVPLATLDDDPGIVAQRHIFVGSKAAWFELPHDGLPRFAEYS